MISRRMAAIWLGLALSCAASSLAQQPLSFEDRIKAQEAIERVYYAHRIWPKENTGPKPAFERAVPRALLEAKVGDSLKKSAAMEKIWQRPIAPGQLQAEMDRMARETRDPALLRELFAALGDDPMIIAECLARPVLADRLVRVSFGDRAARNDRGVSCEDPPGEARFREWWDGEAASFGPDAAVPGTPTVFPYRLPSLKSRSKRSSAGSWDSFINGIPNGRIGHSAVWTGAELIVWGGMWADYNGFDHFEDTGGRYDPATDTWSPTARDTATPSPRSRHTAVWTGTEMIVWGGERNGQEAHPEGTGGRYDPASDRWAPIAIPGDVLTARYLHTAVWTGTEMIVWGGTDGHAALGTGARYRPAEDAWVPVGTNGQAPAARYYHTAVWTGAEMLVWGGISGPSSGAPSFNSGGRYDPVSDSWTSMSTGGGVPEARHYHTAVWTGTEMIVWGGMDEWSYFYSGGRYDPGSDSWTPTAMDSLLYTIGDAWHTAVWTGTEMVVWGGHQFGYATNGGARYDPGNDSWTLVAGGASSPESRLFHSAVWTGTEMVVWGGSIVSSRGLGNYTNSGGRYAPAQDSWIPISNGGAVPSPRAFASAVWTGAEMVVFGGIGPYPPNTLTDTGGCYDPALNRWRPTSTAGAPEARFEHTALWTGQEAVIWGGHGHGKLNTGGRYDPAADAWAPVSLGEGTPSPRTSHTAVWTGSEMIVWGGADAAEAFLDSGGRYDPSQDTWSALQPGGSTVQARSGHTAVWTGSEMVVWGGKGRDVQTETLNTGGRYSPATDSWNATELGGSVPSPRTSHTAVWTGTEMIVWGGLEELYSGATQTGGRYNPDSHSWQPTSVGEGVPEGRDRPTTAWTGTEMIVWGGGGWAMNTGGRYDPSADSWLPTALGPETPCPRYGQVGTWTGHSLLVWGGYSYDWGGHLDSGGQYWPGGLAGPDFSLESTPSILEVPQGSSRSLTLTAHPLNGFEGSVNLEYQAPHFLGTYTLSGDLLVLAAGGSGEVTLTIQADDHAQPGNYTLEVAGMSWGLTRSVSVPFAILPVCRVTCSAQASPASGYAPLTVGFYPSISTEYCSGEGQFEWDFGDGTPHSAEQYPSHTYETAGTYGWTFRYTQDGIECLRSGTVEVTVEPLELSVSAEVSPGSLDVYFYCDPLNGAEPFTFEWDFGDGEHSQEQYPSHTYGAPGQYTYEVRVADSEGRTGQYSEKILVSECSLTCAASASTSQGILPLSVAFTGQVTGTGCLDPAQWNWNFGDGEISSELSPTYVYRTAGYYIWSLSAWADGQHCEKKGSVRVQPSPCQLTCTAQASPSEGHAPLAVAFESFITPIQCQEVPAVTWSFGDGGSAQGATAGHAYAAPGTYSWWATAAADGKYCYAGGTVEVIGPCTMTCAPTATPEQGNAALAVQFLANETLGQCIESPNFNWDFGDGGASSERDPIHVYTRAGTHHWTLAITGEGASCSSSGDITILKGLPGDCDGDGLVSIGEVQRAIGMFLGTQPVACGADCDGDGVVSIGEVQKVINAFLGEAVSC